MNAYLFIIYKGWLLLSKWFQIQSSTISITFYNTSAIPNEKRFNIQYPTCIKLNIDLFFSNPTSWSDSNTVRQHPFCSEGGSQNLMHLRNLAGWFG